jgi:hypothetical protein
MKYKFFDAKGRAWGYDYDTQWMELWDAAEAELEEEPGYVMYDLHECIQYLMEMGDMESEEGTK